MYLILFFLFAGAEDVWNPGKVELKSHSVSFPKPWLIKYNVNNFSSSSNERTVKWKSKRYVAERSKYPCLLQTCSMYQALLMRYWTCDEQERYTIIHMNMAMTYYWHLTSSVSIHSFLFFHEKEDFIEEGKKHFLHTRWMVKTQFQLTNKHLPWNLSMILFLITSDRIYILTDTTCASLVAANIRGSKSKDYGILWRSASILLLLFILNCAYFHFRIQYHCPISYSKQGFQMFPLNATRKHWGHDLLILMSKLWSMKLNEGQRQSWHKANVLKSIDWTLQTLSIRQRKNKKNACNKLSISFSPIAYLIVHIHPHFMFHISTAQSCSVARCKRRNWVKSPQHRTCN